MMVDSSFGYQISDLMMFSYESYLSLITSYNESIWPLQIAFVFNSVLIGALLLKSQAYNPSRWVLLLLCWPWIFLAQVFHQRFFSQLTWVAKYVGLTTLIEAVLMLGFAFLLPSKLVIRKTLNGRHALDRWIFRAAIIVFLICAFIPLSFFFSEERAITEIVLFGWGPGATALGSLAVLFSMRGWPVWILAPIPMGLTLASIIMTVATRP